MTAKMLYFHMELLRYVMTFQTHHSTKIAYELENIKNSYCRMSYQLANLIHLPTKSYSCFKRKKKKNPKQGLESIINIPLTRAVRKVIVPELHF